MQYLGPQPADFHNVRSLNREFLQQLPMLVQGKPSLRDISHALRGRLVTLRPAQRERLAETPFLLFSFRERDNEYWSRLLREQCNADLFDRVATQDDAKLCLVAAGLGYVWQLARQNTYSARLICGASVHWCEQLADKTLLELVTVAVSSVDLLALRASGDQALWEKLLDSGISGEQAIRKAAQVSAMQRVLTDVYGTDGRRMAVAARAGLSPARTVADEMDR